MATPNPDPLTSTSGSSSALSVSSPHTSHNIISRSNNSPASIPFKLTIDDKGQTGTIPISSGRNGDEAGTGTRTNGNHLRRNPSSSSLSSTSSSSSSSICSSKSHKHRHHHRPPSPHKSLTPISLNLKDLNKLSEQVFSTNPSSITRDNTPLGGNEDDDKGGIGIGIEEKYQEEEKKEQEGQSDIISRSPITPGLDGPNSPILGLRKSTSTLVSGDNNIKEGGKTGGRKGTQEDLEEGYNPHHQQREKREGQGQGQQEQREIHEIASVTVPNGTTTTTTTSILRRGTKSDQHLQAHFSHPHPHSHLIRPDPSTLPSTSYEDMTHGSLKRSLFGPNYRQQQQQQSGQSRQQWQRSWPRSSSGSPSAGSGGLGSGSKGKKRKGLNDSSLGVMIMENDDENENGNGDNRGVTGDGNKLQRPPHTRTRSKSLNIPFSSRQEDQDQGQHQDEYDDEDEDDGTETAEGTGDDDLFSSPLPNNNLLHPSNGGQLYAHRRAITTSNSSTLNFNPSAIPGTRPRSTTTTHFPHPALRKRRRPTISGIRNLSYLTGPHFTDDGMFGSGIDLDSFEYGDGYNYDLGLDSDAWDEREVGTSAGAGNGGGGRGSVVMGKKKTERQRDRSLRRAGDGGSKGGGGGGGDVPQVRVEDHGSVGLERGDRDDGASVGVHGRDFASPSQSESAAAGGSSPSTSRQNQLSTPALEAQLLSPQPLGSGGSSSSSSASPSSTSPSIMPSPVSVSESLQYSPSPKIHSSYGTLPPPYASFITTPRGSGPVLQIPERKRTWFRLALLQTSSFIISTTALIFIVIWALSVRFFEGVRETFEDLFSGGGIEGEMRRRKRERGVREWERENARMGKYRDEEVTKNVRYYARTAGVGTGVRDPFGTDDDEDGEIGVGMVGRRYRRHRNHHRHHRHHHKRVKSKKVSVGNNKRFSIFGIPIPFFSSSPSPTASYQPLPTTLPSLSSSELKEPRYDIDEQDVMTEDGYWLRVHRIVVKGERERIDARGDGKGGWPVYIQHGLFQSSGSFITSEERSLAFWLAERGFQVYLGNNRGVFDMSHETLGRNDPRFWDYNIKELALYDLPAIVDHILRETGHEKVSFIGHSQGNATMFCSLAEGMVPELGEKLSVFIALAPAVYAGPLTTGFPFNGVKSMKWRPWRRFFGVLDFIPVMRIAYDWTPSKPFGLLGYQMFAFLFNWTDRNWLKRRKMKMFRFTPSPVASAGIFWWTGYQGFSTRGCVLDPEVDKWWDKRFPPLSIYHGGKDYLVLTEPLLERLREKEKDVNVIRIDKLEDGEHCDSFWHEDAVELCFGNLLDDIESTIPQRKTTSSTSTDSE